MAQGKVMVVDDSPLILEVVGSILSSAGYEVLTRSVAIGASAAILRERPALVLIDVSMPLVTGTEISQSLRDSRARTESIIVLHSDRPADQLAALVVQCGADGFIRKTGNARELLAEVAKWLTRGRSDRAKTNGVLVAASERTRAIVREAVGTRAPLQVTDSGAEAFRAICGRSAPRSVVLGSGLQDLNAAVIWRKSVELDPRWRDRIVVVDEGDRDARAWPPDVTWWGRTEPPEALLRALAISTAGASP